MKNKLEYRIENGSLIIDNYFNNLKIGSINGGSVENILNKCKLYDEEYETLLKENEYMKHIAKDFEQLQQENKKLKMIVNEYERLNKGFKITDVQKYNIDELLSYKKYKDNWNELKEWVKEQPIFNYLAPVDIKNKMQELERGVSDDNH